MDAMDAMNPMNPIEPMDRLLADVGGTNARFALQADAGAPITDAQTLSCSDFPTIAHAIAAYRQGLNRPAPRLCAIAIATAVLGDRVKMTNHDWEFSISALQAQFAFETLRVINDFTALALAIPTLRNDEVRQVGGGNRAGAGQFCNETGAAGLGLLVNLFSRLGRQLASRDQRARQPWERDGQVLFDKGFGSGHSTNVKNVKN